MIKVILFDADGVLINGDRFSVHLARDYGITVEATASFFKGVMRDCVGGKADIREVLPPYLKEWGWKKSLEEFLDYWHKVEHNIDEPVVEYILQLRKKGILCCLATNQEKTRFEYMLKEMGFSSIFDHVYCSSNLETKKPEQKFYQKILEDLHIQDKQEVLFWDDDPENVEGARQFGIQAELYTTFNDFKDKMKNYVQS